MERRALILTSLRLGGGCCPRCGDSAWQPELPLLSAARRSGGFEHRVSLPECSRRIAPLPRLRHVSAWHTSSTQPDGSANPYRCIGSSRRSWWDARADREPERSCIRRPRGTEPETAVGRQLTAPARPTAGPDLTRPGPGAR